MNISSLFSISNLKQRFAAPMPGNLTEEILTAAIAAAEKGNRGEVRLHLEHRSPHRDVVQRARELFFNLGMDRTEEETGVLLYVALKDRRAAVFAGAGIFGSQKPEYWQKIIDRVSRGFAEGDIAAGLIEALTMTGDLLREKVPGDDGAGNELSNRVSIDESAGSVIHERFFQAAVALLILVAVPSIISLSRLNSSLVAAEKQSSQLSNVLERQSVVKERYRDRSSSEFIEGELAGSENRVRVERLRYDRAAADYNERAGAFPGRLWVSLFRFPHKLRLSGEKKLW